MLIGAYFAVGVFDHDIWAPTEPAVAGVVWEMYAHGDLAVPRINGLPYLEKPPLYYWAAWACCKVGGRISAGLLRLPAVMFGILCLLLAFWAARARYGAAAAWLATVLAATAPSFYILSHRATTDMAATFFTFLCFALFASTLSSSEDTPKRHPLDILFALALALSFYSKNFYTWLIVLPPVLLFLAYKRLYRRIGVIVGLLAVFFVLLVTPWCLAVFRRGGWEYLRIVFVDNTLGRFFSMVPWWPVTDPLNDAYRAEKDNPRLIYLAMLFVFSAPWALAFIASVTAFFRKRGGDFRLFLKIAFIAIPVVLTLSSSRAGEYLMPIYFVTILMTAELLRDLLQEATRQNTRLEGKARRPQYRDRPRSVPGRAGGGQFRAPNRSAAPLADPRAGDGGLAGGEPAPGVAHVSRPLDGAGRRLRRVYPADRLDHAAARSAEIVRLLLQRRPSRRRAAQVVLEVLR